MYLREHISIDGMPLHIVDTAGLRESEDKVEQEGIRRAHQEIKKADLILFVIEAAETLFELPTDTPVILIRNKLI